MSDVQAFLDREASSWAAFEAQVASVPEDRRETPGVVGDWTLKDVVWHCAHWTRFAADHLMMTGDGPFADPFELHPDELVDSENAEIAKISAAMSWEDVVRGAQEARASVRIAVARPGLAAEPIAWAADESWIHYDEHGADVEAFAEHQPE
jgi:hypothetical protein